MRPDYTLVRDALPQERLSCARIREWLAADADLGHWSRTAPGAIRPQQLAALIRDRLWEAHDVTLAAVRQRLQQNGATPQLGHADYWVKIKIERQPEEAEVVSRTRFSLTPSGRISAEIHIIDGANERAVTVGPVSLRRREET